MRKNILSTLVLLGAGSMLTACNFDQPEAGCIVQDALVPWFAKYDLVEGPTGAACTGKVAPAGEQLGVWKFVDPETNKATLTIRPQTLAALGARDPGNKYGDLQGLGNLNLDVDENDFCTATDFTEAKVNAGPNAAGTSPATTVSYVFSNVKVYSAPSAPGTQMTGELTFTKDGCVSKYVMRALWPVTGCDPTLDASDPENGPSTCGEGSGLNPDFAVVCDEDTEACVPAKAIPSFK